MGRGKARTQRKHFSQNRENIWKKSRSENNNNNENNNNENNNIEKKVDRSWEPFATQNAAFDHYYKEQGIVPPDEWDTFMEMLRKPLPAAFRINSSSQFSGDIKAQLENDFMNSLQAEAPDGSEVEGIKPLSWYPDNLAWHSNFSRMQLRKNQTLVRFHEFLKQENEIGNITRQEAVSMVPPLFLDVLPEHFVLDMCAAPGSKTFQLLEMIYRLNESGSLPSGLVIANDSDVQRCNLLIHQTKRMCTANLIVTNHEAQHFPSCHLNKNRPKGSRSETKSGLTQLLFDRVLCDVPCSGDGTLRKAPDIWRRWSIGTGNGIHGLQIQIAMRGLSLLKVGGRMVYSTCSMNPIENEAVVSEILRRCEGAVELVDVSNELPQLVRRPGLKKWKVRDKVSWFGSHKDVPKSQRAAFMPSMFPSGKGCVEVPDDNDSDAVSMDTPNDGLEASSGVLDEEVSDLPLERCMRIVPHDQNTGAFFVAVLHKLSPLPAIEKKPTSRNQLNRKVGCTDDKLTSEVKDVNGDTNGVEESLPDVAEEQLEGIASDPDLMNTECEEPALVTDSGKVSEEDKTKEDFKGAADKAVGAKRKLQKQGRWKGVDPVLFLKSDSIANCIKTFYGIDETFPFKDHLVTRNSDTDHVKRIYYVSKSVKNVLELNLLGGQQMKITSVGLKMFERQTSKECSSSPCMFRISSEGLPLMLPHVSNQILYASLVDFKHLLQYRTIKFADFVDADFRENALKLMVGCCSVVLREGTENTANPPRINSSTIAIGAWRGRTNIAVMITVTDSQELLQRLSVRMAIKDGSLVPENKSACQDLEEAAKCAQLEDVEVVEGSTVS